ncbi:MAG: M20/M25/M40 family metallo-hydrolase [Helicobacteraceae bacterium]|nr:M20/M25/M40 family metallo-hydrolase [Helicobacteraceae bacterium]
MEKYDFLEFKLFLEICKIPHASFKTELLRDFIAREAESYGAKVTLDKAGNIHCIKGTPKLCLQGHYDMVYVSKNKEFLVEPKIISENGKEFLVAKDSSLGADNGVAVACMLETLRTRDNIECLFSNDEEVGMIGANNIELGLESKFMLNLDSEDIDEVVYSCAGGYDLEAKIEFKKLEILQNYVFFKAKTQGFKGGHSGIEIHKNIKNAIIEAAILAESLVKIGAKICHFSGGEKRNSIPTGALIIFGIPQNAVESCKNIIAKSGQFTLSECEKVESYFDITPLLKAILSLENGVLQTKNGEPILSSSIGILEQIIKDNKTEFKLCAMGRGNVESLMKAQSKKECEKLEALGFSTKILDFYSPWEREDSTLLEIVKEVYQKRRENPQIKGIHAGLECGILKQKYPQISFASIGPTITHPHSINERLDLDSFVEFCAILKEILNRFC